MASYLYCECHAWGNPYRHVLLCYWFGWCRERWRTHGSFSGDTGERPEWPSDLHRGGLQFQLTGRIVSGCTRLPVFGLYNRIEYGFSDHRGQNSSSTHAIAWDCPVAVVSKRTRFHLHLTPRLRRAARSAVERYCARLSRHFEAGFHRSIPLTESKQDSHAHSAELIVSLWRKKFGHPGLRV